MTTKFVRLGCLVVLAGTLLAASGAGQTRPGTPPGGSTPAKFTPKFEALAETRLLMEGLAATNYRSLTKHLKTRPADNDTWVFARGQALLLAETGNLLLLRPPRNTGRDTWMKLAMDMRDQTGNLARALGARDYARSKAGMVDVANACNRCHVTFRVDVRVQPSLDERDRDARAEIDPVALVPRASSPVSASGPRPPLDTFPLVP